MSEDNLFFSYKEDNLFEHTEYCVVVRFSSEKERERFAKLLVRKTLKQLEQKLSATEQEADDKNIYKFLLVHTLESQMTLDILNHIQKLQDDDIIDAGQISRELGYKKESVQKIIDEIKNRR